MRLLLPLLTSAVESRATLPQLASASAPHTPQSAADGSARTPPPAASTSHVVSSSPAPLTMDESAAFELSVPAAGGKKRLRRDTPMLMRAERAGVAHKLKQLPDSPERDEMGWCDDDAYEAYKRAKQTVQTTNQQIVARAEKQLLKRL